ncbi:hypothetical protein KPL71_003739 [Citrus sinensis]|uniref:Uncharacterized protein n=2 Tax=Citrus sinensis TaxID=2711 RepID=A0ACB8N0I5_CITSI|nr:hypothetical protein KPL71_003739 [Citrus sinensis]
MGDRRHFSYGAPGYGYPPPAQYYPPPPGAAYPPQGYPPQGYGYSPVAGYPPSGYSTGLYAPPHHSGGLLAGAAAAYGTHHMSHHGYGGHHHGKFKHGKHYGGFRHGKHGGKKWKSLKYATEIFTDNAAATRNLAIHKHGLQNKTALLRGQPAREGKKLQDRFDYMPVRPFKTEDHKGMNSFGMRSQL